MHLEGQAKKVEFVYGRWSPWKLFELFRKTLRQRWENGMEQRGSQLPGPANRTWSAAGRWLWGGKTWMDFGNLKELGMRRNSKRLLGAEPMKRNRLGERMGWVLGPYNIQEELFLGQDIEKWQIQWESFQPQSKTNLLGGLRCSHSWVTLSATLSLFLGQDKYEWDDQ